MTLKFLPYLGLLTVACAIKAANIFEAVGAAVASAFADVFNLFRPDPLAFAGAPLELSRATFGQSVDAATQHSLRHEAGVGRIAAARNI